MPDYLPRFIDPLLGELLTDHPAVLVVGPRACGKTTTGRRHCRERLRLDRPAEAAVARADPDAALADGPFPLLVDEWQVVPEVLGAVKRAVDEGAAVALRPSAVVRLASRLVRPDDHRPLGSFVDRRAVQFSTCLGHPVEQP